MSEKLELNFKDNNIKEVVINGVSFKPTPEPKPAYHRGWVPDVDEEYYYITSAGGIWYTINVNATTDKSYIAQGNCYPTREIAEKARDRRALVAELWREDGVLHEVDWADRGQPKSFLGYDGAWRTDWTHLVQYNFGLPHFKTKEHVKAIIKKYGDRLDLLSD